jgi:hypothetical protein
LGTSETRINYMSITARLKQVSVETLEILREDPLLLPAFFDAKFLPESPYWQKALYIGKYAERLKQEVRAKFGRTSHNPNKWIGNYNWEILEQQFLSEWETPHLDLHKYFPELTFLMAGYVPGEVSSQWTIPEIKALFIDESHKYFLSFLVIENSEWDNLPLVNAIGAGKEIDYETDYGQVRYLLTDEVGQILDGLLLLSQEGFQERFKRESEKAELLPWIDWSEEKMLDGLTEYYNQITSYYEETLRNQQAMLLDVG